MSVETSTVQVVMPAMGDSVTEGTVLEWHKQEGDTVEADETLVEISTDKVDAEVPAPARAPIVKIHAAEGDTVAVGTLLAEIAADAAAQRLGKRTRRHAGRRCRSPKVGRVTGGEPRPRGTRPLAWPPPRPPMGPRSTSSPRRAASRSPRARSSSGPSRSATPSRTARPSSRSRPTRSTWSCPPAAGTITEILAAEGETVTVGQVIAKRHGGWPAGTAGRRAIQRRAGRRPRPPRPRQTRPSTAQ